MIQENLYKKILEYLPILCVDVIIKDLNGSILLIKRNNEPLKGEWWVIGGRVLHGENATDAAKRKVLEEIGIEIKSLDFIGYYEENFDKNSFQEDCLYHTISLVFETETSGISKINLDKQSSDWKWASNLPNRFQVKSLNIV